MIRREEKNNSGLNRYSNYGLCCIISEIRLDIARKSRLFVTLAVDAPVRRVLSVYCDKRLVQKYCFRANPLLVSKQLAHIG